MFKSKLERHLKKFASSCLKPVCLRLFQKTIEWVENIRGVSLKFSNNTVAILWLTARRGENFCK